MNYVSIYHSIAFLLYTFRSCPWFKLANMHVLYWSNGNDGWSSMFYIAVFGQEFKSPKTNKITFPEVRI